MFAWSRCRCAMLESERTCVVLPWKVKGLLCSLVYYKNVAFPLSISIYKIVITQISTNFYVGFTFDYIESLLFCTKMSLCLLSILIPALTRIKSLIIFIIMTSIHLLPRWIIIDINVVIKCYF